MYKFKVFELASSLVEFLNENRINRKDIISIVSYSDGKLLLTYYEEDYSRIVGALG
jgi:hypothetical protein